MRQFCLLFLVLYSLQSLALQVKILAEDDWYPYSAQVNGKAEGFAVDTVNEAFKVAGIEVIYEIMPYPRCMKLVHAGTEVGCFNTAVDASMHATQIFPKEPLFNARSLIFAPANYTGPTNLSLKDLKGKTVGITNGYTYGDAFEKSTDFKKDVAQKDSINLKKLAMGRLDFAIVYEKVANSIIGKNPSVLKGKCKPVGEIENTNLFVSFSKKHPDGEKMMRLLDEGLKKIKANGTYLKLVSDWDVRLAKGL